MWILTFQWDCKSFLWQFALKLYLNQTTLPQLCWFDDRMSMVPSESTKNVIAFPATINLYCGSCYKVSVSYANGWFRLFFQIIYSLSQHSVFAFDMFLIDSVQQIHFLLQIAWSVCLCPFLAQCSLSPPVSSCPQSALGVAPDGGCGWDCCG